MGQATADADGCTVYVVFGNYNNMVQIYSTFKAK